MKPIEVVIQSPVPQNVRVIAHGGEAYVNERDFMWALLLGPAEFDAWIDLHGDRYTRVLHEGESYVHLKTVLRFCTMGRTAGRGRSGAGSKLLCCLRTVRACLTTGQQREPIGWENYPEFLRDCLDRAARSLDGEDGGKGDGDAQTRTAALEQCCDDLYDAYCIAANWLAFSRKLAGEEPDQDFLDAKRRKKEELEAMEQRLAKAG